MASSNPFYVGYHPDDKPTQIKPKNILQGADPQKALDSLLNTGLLDQALQDIDVPRYVKEKIKNDFLSSLAVQIKDSSVSAADLALLPPEALQDMQGSFGIKISLNPLDWKDDPVKQLKKTLSSWVKAAYDPDDFRTTTMMKVAQSVYGNSKPYTRTSSGASRRYIISDISDRLADLQHKIDESAISSAALRDSARAGRNREMQAAVAAGDPNPLKIVGYVTKTERKSITVKDASGADVTISADKVSDPYSDVVQSYISFLQSSSSGTSKREGGMDGLISSGVGAILSEIDVDIEGLSLAPGVTDYSDKVRALIDTRFAGQPAAVRDTYVSQILSLHSQQELAKSMYGFNEFLSNANPAKSLGISAALDQYMAVGRSQRQALAADPAFMARFTNYSAEAAKARTALENFKLSPEYLRDPDKYKGIVKSFERNFKQLDSRVAPLVTAFQANPSVNSARALATASKRITAVGLTAPIAGGDHLQRAPLRKLYRQMYEDHLRPQGPGIINSGLLQRSLGLGVLFNEAEKIRNENWAEDVLQLLEGGKLTDTFVWMRVKNTFPYVFPSYWVGRVLDKVQYFGLVIDESSIEKTTTTLFGIRRFYKDLLENSDGGGVLGFLFVNKVKVEATGFFGDIVKLNLTGGAHMNGALAMSKWLISNAGSANISDIDDMVKGMLTNFRFHYLADGSINIANTKSALTDFLLRDPKYKNLLPTLFKDGADLDDFLGKFIVFKQYVDAKLAKYLGISIDMLDQGLGLEFVVFQELHKFNLSNDTRGKLAVKLMGPLQKIALKLNILQTNILNKFPITRLIFGGQNALLGLLLGGTYALKSNVAAFIKSGLAKLFGKFGGGAVSGFFAWLGPLGAMLGKFADKLLTILIRKGLDMLEGLTKAIIHLDISYFTKSYSKFVDNTTKIIVYLLAIPLLLMFLFAAMINTVFNSSTPPTSQAAVGQSTPLTGGCFGSGCGSGTGSTYECGISKTTGNTCIFKDGNYSVMNGSLNIGADSGHGSNSYWDWLVAKKVIGSGQKCSFTLPMLITDGIGPTRITDSGSIPGSFYCRGDGTTTESPLYGYAVDYYTAPNCGSVFAPPINGNSVTWNLTPYPTLTGAGDAVFLTTTQGGTTYRLTLLHVVNIVSATSVDTGDFIADMYNWQVSGSDNSHIHVEYAEVTGGAVTVMALDDPSTGSPAFCR
ncbi:hypothetical protein H6802_00940 [Candidatus Nomurabacteria bacterium]|uniref:Uncharacterized protein n=1 Tax=candidate division WWE3 bacterium TaxID=2053526 RepID=A0A955E1E3_UNCKA|nr:hypothetical protein [candidate division WWE3 bacterium]MCB9823510.1 hypothetical protein [Candidatus Nomurabacteria bacterium]MCB9827305.1 hypothetical protein [Candidatus Nomurabacteria bacterium]HXK52397.1 hypothetical protein [bacterium]